MSTKEANDDEVGALLVPRPDRVRCLLAQRCADRSNLRSILRSSPEGEALIDFPSQSHHMRVSLKIYRNASDDNCETSVKKTIQLHIRNLKCAWFGRQDKATKEHTSEGTGVKP